VASWLVSLASRSPSVAVPIASGHQPRTKSTAARLARATISVLTVPKARLSATRAAYCRWAAARSAAGSATASSGHRQIAVAGGQVEGVGWRLGGD
jgi:hypothetical protein